MKKFATDVLFGKESRDYKRTKDRLEKIDNELKELESKKEEINNEIQENAKRNESEPMREQGEQKEAEGTVDSDMSKVNETELQDGKETKEEVTSKQKESSGAKKPQEKQKTVKTATVEQESKQEPQESLKEGDDVTVYKDTYINGKKTEKRYKAKIVKINDDGTYDLRRGKIIYKGIKPNKISKIKPSKTVDIKKETEGLSFKDQVKQGFEEYVSSIKEKSRDRLNSVLSFMKDKINEQRSKLKDFKERKAVIESFAKDLLSGLSKSGIKAIPTRKVNTIISQIQKSKTDESLNNAANKLIEIAQNIAVTDEEIKAKAKINKLKKQAKKNAKQKAGQLSSEIATILSLDEVPPSLKKEYEEVLEDIGQKGGVIEIKNQKKIIDLANKIADKYSVKELEESDKNEDIERPEDKSEELASARFNLDSIDDSKPLFESEEKNRIAMEFKKLTDEFLALLPKSVLKNIAKEAKNIQNGFMSNAFAENLVIKNNALQKANTLASNKNIFTTIKNKIKDATSKAKKIIDKASKFQLNHIDQALGSIKNTAIYENIVSPLTTAFSKSTLETKIFINKLSSLTNKAISSRSRLGRFGKGLGFNAEAQFRLNVITDLFLIDKQHQLNPDNKLTPSVKSIIETINNDNKEDGSKSGYTDKDVKIINEIYEKAPKNKDGSLNLDEYKNKYMTNAESNLLSFIENMYEEYKEKAIYLSEQLRGETLSTFNAYAPRNTVTRKELSTQDKIEQWKGKYKVASSTKSRTDDAPLVRLGGVTNAVRYVNEINEDYYATKSIREVDATLNYLKDMVSNENKPFVEQFKGFVDSHIIEQYNKSLQKKSELDKFVNEAARGVYSNLLINIKRFFPELASNIAVSVVEAKNLYRISKDGNFSEVIDGAKDVMKKFGSAHVDRVGSFTLDLRDVEGSPFGEGFKSSQVKTTSQLNELLANNVVKNASKALNKMYYSMVDFMIPQAWGAEFAVEFKKETGKNVDMKKVATDNAYYIENKQAIDRAIARADKHISDLYNTASQFEKRLDSKQTKSAVMQMMKFFMQSFSFNEWAVLRSGATSTVGMGSMGREEGAAKATAAVIRMFIYSAGGVMMQQLASSLFDDDDDFDFDTMFEDLFKKASADVVSIALFGNKVAWAKTAINTTLNGAIELYEKYLEEKGEEMPINIKNSKGYYPFFGLNLRSYRDSFKLLGGLGYIANESITLGKEGYKLAEKIAKGEFDKEEYDAYKIKMASFKIFSAMLGIPFIKDAEMMIDRYKEGNEAKQKNYKPR